MTKELRNELLAEVNLREKNKKGHVNYICKKFNCSKKKARRIISKLKQKEDIEDVLAELEDLPNEQKDSIVSIGGKYVYNAETDLYIVPLSTYGRDYVCSGEQHRAMLLSYSNWKGSESSITEIARIYNMRREWVKEYFKIMGWTHDSLPISDEEIINQTDQEAIKRIIDTKKVRIQQELLHKDWKATQIDATKWREFQSGKLDPFIRAIKNFKPKQVAPLRIKIPKKKVVKNAFIIGLSDLHFGAKANAEELVTGKDFNSETINKIIDNYAMQIARDVSDRNYTFSKCVCIVAGDILHTLTGFTEKGTVLEADVLREEQFELAFQSLARFLTRMLQIFGNVELHMVKGNHAGPSEYMLFYALKSHYNKVPELVFHLYKERAAIFRVLKTAILLDHGESDYIKAKVPQPAAAREAYIHKRFLQQPEKLVGTTSKLMIVGDLHHFEHIEFNSCEFIMLSSAVCGDRYADHLALNSRPRQNCIILDNSGVKEVLHYYFDEIT